MEHTFRLALLCISLVVSSVAPVSAKPPQVRFDMLPAVACRDLTDEEFVRVHPGERLYEVRLEISALITGEAADVTELRYRLLSAQNSFRIADYAPRTTLASDFQGSIAMEEKRERSTQAGLGGAGPWPPFSITGHAESGLKELVTRKYEVVPPAATVTASGTIEQGQGVYFKLRPSRQTSLEGAQEFQLVFRTPASWRGDLLHVRCEAWGMRRSLVASWDDQVPCGAGDFAIALYRAGDEEAQAVAERYAESTQKLRWTVAHSRDEIRRRSYPTPLHELGGLLDLAEPKIPPTWLDQLLQDSASGHGFENRLPAQVRSAAAEYLIAKRELRKLTR